MDELKIPESQSIITIVSPWVHAPPLNHYKVIAFTVNWKKVNWQCLVILNQKISEGWKVLEEISIFLFLCCQCNPYGILCVVLQCMRYYSSRSQLKRVKRAHEILLKLDLDLYIRECGIRDCYPHLIFLLSIYFSL